jgi:hypothetical protein
MVSTTVEWQSPTTGRGQQLERQRPAGPRRLSKEQRPGLGGVVLRGEPEAGTARAHGLRAPAAGIISQLRSHAGVALYEICTRYKDIGRTARQAWRWWCPVLSGNPPSEKSARLEYRIFKRDTLKPAIAEVNAITDIDVELVEHKDGRASWARSSSASRPSARPNSA